MYNVEQKNVLKMEDEQRRKKRKKMRRLYVPTWQPLNMKCISKREREREREVSKG